MLNDDATDIIEPDPEDPRDLYMTLQQAAKSVGLSVSRTLFHIRKGAFPGAQKMGKTWLIPRGSVAAFVSKPVGRPRL